MGSCYDERNKQIFTIPLVNTLSSIDEREPDSSQDMNEYSLLTGFDALPLCEQTPVSSDASQWKGWDLFLAASFLVSVPVFFEAPLVRNYPWISLAIAPFLAILAWSLEHRSQSNRWGDLLWGFTLTWLAGALYWGWFRWEPLLHLPMECLGVPIVLWSIKRQKWMVGSFFYLGSLLGTAITDSYFYLVDLIPYWRSVMRVDTELGSSIFQNALMQMQSPWAMGCAGSLIVLLLGLGLFPFLLIGKLKETNQLYWWGYSGAILCTLVVDGLFWLTAQNLS